MTVTLRDAPSGPVQTKNDRLIALPRQVPAAKTVIMHPCAETSLRGATEAAELGIIFPILLGPAAGRGGRRSAQARHRQVRDRRRAAQPGCRSEGVELICQSRGELLVNGSLHTDELMHAVTSSATDLRTARRGSDVFIMDVPTYSETLFTTDLWTQIYRVRRDWSDD